MENNYFCNFIPKTKEELIVLVKFLRKEINLMKVIKRGIYR